MKKKMNIMAVAVAAGLLCSCASQAQELPEPLIQAARKAVLSSPEVQARWHNLTGAMAERDVARAGYKPQVDVTVGAGRERATYAQPSAAMTAYSRSGGTVSLTQVLFDGFYTRNEVKRLGFAEMTRYHELLDVSENTALEAVRAYADVTRYTELVEEAKANYVEHKLTSQQIAERSAAGVARRVDLEQATGRLALAESNLLTEVSNLNDVSARYQRIVGELPAKGTPWLGEGSRLKGIPTSAQAAMEAGLQGSPAIRAAYENARSAQAQIDARKSAYGPRVDFRVRESWGRNIDGVRGTSNSTVAEVVMNYNLYKGGADQAREKQAVEFHAQAQDLQEKACRDVRQTLAIAYNDVVRLREQLGYLDQHRLSTEKAREAYRQQFDIGQRTLLDLLDTQNEFFEASRAHINARYNEFVAQARTLASMGQLTAALGVRREGLVAPGDADSGEGGAVALCPPMVMADTLVVDKAQALADAPPRARARPVVPVPVVQAKVTLSADALFDFDRAELKPEGKSRLEAWVATLKGVKFDSITAKGHTDSLGTDAYNQRLSLARAQAVKAHLVGLGLPTDKVLAEGRGEAEPVAGNDTEEGRARNRRVDVTVLELR